jgi:hypothetical protein
LASAESERVVAWGASALEVLDDLETGEHVWEDAAAGGGVTDPAASVIGSVIEDTLLESKSSTYAAARGSATDPAASAGNGVSVNATVEAATPGVGAAAAMVIRGTARIASGGGLVITKDKAAWTSLGKR